MPRPPKPQQTYGIQLSQLQWMVRLVNDDPRVSRPTFEKLNLLTSDIMRMLLDIQMTPLPDETEPSDNTPIQVTSQKR